jgi:hypothetical protein
VREVLTASIETARKDRLTSEVHAAESATQASLPPPTGNGQGGGPT